VNVVPLQPTLVGWIKSFDAAVARATTSDPRASHRSVPKPVPGPSLDNPQTLVGRCMG
jgi:hypothetical protein